jgi:hypothetical protein
MWAVGRGLWGVKLLGGKTPSFVHGETSRLNLKLIPLHGIHTLSFGRALYVQNFMKEIVGDLPKNAWQEKRKGGQTTVCRQFKLL